MSAMSKYGLCFQFTKCILAVLLLLSRSSYFTGAHGKVLWDGDPNKGLSVFVHVQNLTGTISVADDPQGRYGKVFEFSCHDKYKKKGEPGSRKARCEVSRTTGFELTNNGTYFMGWRSLWGPLPTKQGKWQVLSQILRTNYNGRTNTTAVAFGLSVPGDGKMYWNVDKSGTPEPVAATGHQKVDGGNDFDTFWYHRLPIGNWHSYVMHIKMGETAETGWVEVWYDGVKQILENGKTRFPAAFADKGYNGAYLKWGIYRSGAAGDIGYGFHYLSHPRVGTSYVDVAPEIKDGEIPIADTPTGGPNSIPD